MQRPHNRLESNNIRSHSYDAYEHSIPIRLFRYVIAMALAKTHMNIQSDNFETID